MTQFPRIWRLIPNTQSATGANLAPTANPALTAELNVWAETGQVEVTDTLGNPVGLGALVVAEVLNPANGATLYSVPAHLTFTGRCIVSANGGGSLGASVSAGALLNEIVASGVGQTLPASAEVTVSNSASVALGIVTVVTGNAYGSVALVGRVK